MESNDGGDTVTAEEPPPVDRDGNTSRILLISERGVPGTQTLGVTGWTAAEDLLVSPGGAALPELRRRGDGPDVRARRRLGHLLRRSSRSGVLVPPLARPSTPIEGRYDVAIAVMYSVWNLPLLERIRGLRRAADTVVVWFPEVWPSQLTSRLATQPFAVCGEIVVGEPQSAERLSRILGRTVHFVPLATDVERFAVEGTDSPLAAPDAGRPIAVTNIGRRDERLHANLMAWVPGDGQLLRVRHHQGADGTRCPCAPLGDGAAVAQDSGRDHLVCPARRARCRGSPAMGALAGVREHGRRRRARRPRPGPVGAAQAVRPGGRPPAAPGSGARDADHRRSGGDGRRRRTVGQRPLRHGRSRLEPPLDLVAGHVWHLGARRNPRTRAASLARRRAWTRDQRPNEEDRRITAGPLRESDVRAGQTTPSLRSSASGVFSAIDRSDRSDRFSM